MKKKSIENKTFFNTVFLNIYHSWSMLKVNALLLYTLRQGKAILFVEQVVFKTA